MDEILIAPVIANRIIKILGNASKGFCHVFYYFFPTKRFIIPDFAPAKGSSASENKITPIVWQTNYTEKVTLPIYLNFLFNRLMSHGYEYRYVSTEAREAYIEANAPERVAKAYALLNNGAAQADLWRMLVLYNEGGVYMDIDAHLVWPLSKMIQPEDTELFLRTKKDFSNYFIAAAKGHPALKKTLDIIVENIEARDVAAGVYNMTGPNAFNRALEGMKFNYRLYRYICVQGSFTNEYFQYVDHPRGKWTKMDRSELLKESTETSEG